MSVYRIVEIKVSNDEKDGKTGCRQKRPENSRVAEETRPGIILRNNPDYKAIMATGAAEAANEGTATR